MTADTHSRLADGAAAAANTEAYVTAYVTAYMTASYGAGHPGLTGEGVRGLYSAEDGLSLQALDADSAALAAAGSVAEEALALHRQALAVLTEGWRGGSSSAADDLLRQQCAEAADVVTALHGAAGELRSLRQRLADLRDEKVDAAIRIDDRRAAERPAWLAHARAAMDDGADPEAIEAIRREIAPYVASDIRSDWMAAMQSGTESVAGAYGDTAARLSDRPMPRFDSPQPSAYAGPMTPLASPQPVPAWPSGATQSALPNLGGALVGLVAQIAEALGPDVGIPADIPAANHADSTTDSSVDGPADRRQADPPPRPDPVGRPVPPQAAAATSLLPASAAPESQVDVAPPPLPPAPPPPDLLAAERPPEPEVPHEPAPALDAGPASDMAGAAETPCEIAADELPQVGQ